MGLAYLYTYIGDHWGGFRGQWGGIYGSPMERLGYTKLAESQLDPEIGRVTSFLTP